MLQIIFSYSFLVALVAVVYSVLLTEPDQIFSGLYKWLEKKLMAKQHYLKQLNEPPEEKFPVYVGKSFLFFDWHKKVRDYEWLFLPLIGCERCVAGQMALWLFYPMCYFMFIQYNVLYHIAFISTTIYFTVIIKTIYLWMKTIQQKY